MQGATETVSNAREASRGGWWAILGARVLLAWFGLVGSETRAVVVFQDWYDSRVLSTQRLVRVWVPFGYSSETQRRYPVLYLNDGQNMLSIVGTNAALGWGSWDLDRLVDDLVSSNRMRPVILVSVDASSARYQEYRGPAAGRAGGPDRAPEEDGAYSAYRRFLVEELKPWVDGRYRTLTNASNTGVLGASLGGLCSLSLALDRPDVFGLAGCLSGSFQVEREEFMRRLRARADSMAGLRVYLDSGTVDFTGGDDGRSRTDAVAAELRRLGGRDGRDFLRFTDYQPLTHRALEAAGLGKAKIEEAKRSQHNEFYWRRRVWRALEFLFPPVPGAGVDGVP